MVLFSFIAVLLIVFRLGYIQLLNGVEYRERSDNNRFRQLTSMAPRGIVFDSRGVQLASNSPGYFVAIYDTRSAQQIDALQKLVDILDPSGENEDITVEEFLRRIHQNRYRRWQPVRLIDSHLEFGDPRLIQIAEMRLELPDVIVQVQPVRSYPQGPVAAHLLGGMGRYAGSWEELQSLWDQGLEGYRIDSIVGRWGLEAAYEFVPVDTSLKGVDGWQWVEVDNLSRPVQELEAIASTPGNNIHLTIDAALQDHIEKWLAEEYVPNVLSTFAPDAKEIGAVALDPRTGQILMSVSYPSFSPEMLSREWAELVTAEDRPLENKVVTAYPPGSIFKPVTMIAALTQGASLTDTHRCEGQYFNAQFLGADRKVCWVWSQNRSQHGVLDILGALQRSCNVYFYNLGINMYTKLGTANVLDPIANAAAFLGLGIDTPLPELKNFRQEAGVLPTSEGFRELQRAYLRRNPAPEFQRWINPYPSEVLDITIGQGIQTYTPLQIANYMAMLATGHRYRPYVVEKITSPEGDVIIQTEPKLEASLVKSSENPEGLISQADLAVIQEGLRRVTQVSGGTGYSTFWNAPYFTSGKTGTAEVANRDAHGWFAAWGAENQTDEPEIVVSVFVKHGTGGSRAAGPIAREILDTFFRLKTERDIP